MPRTESGFFFSWSPNAGHFVTKSLIINSAFKLAAVLGQFAGGVG